MDSVVPDIDSPDEDDKEEEGDELYLPEGPTPDVYRNPFEASVDSDAKKVLRRLTRHGFIAYLVGGGVRDLLLEREPKDFDVATSARPEQVRRLFRNCRIIGRRFRLAHILFAQGKIIETATFRRDPGNEPSKPNSIARDDDDLLIRHDNVFGEPHEDAIRRDFTMNGLFYDLDQDIVIDYVGGVEDIRRGLVRTIGDPFVRLREDPVRILRAIKFSARLDFGVEPFLYDAMVKHRTDLERSARPRVLEEILRLLRGGAAHRSTYLMWDTGVLAVILPELASYLDDDAVDAELVWKRLSVIDRLKQDGDLPGDAVLVASLLWEPLAEWLEGARDASIAFEEFFDDISVRLAVPRRLKDRIRSITIAQRRLRSGKLGALPRRDFFPDAAALFAIDQEARGEPIPRWVNEPTAAGLEAPSASRSRRRRRRRRR